MTSNSEKERVEGSEVKWSDLAGFVKFKIAVLLFNSPYVPRSIAFKIYRKFIWARQFPPHKEEIIDL